MQSRLALAILCLATLVGLSACQQKDRQTAEAPDPTPASDTKPPEQPAEPASPLGQSDFAQSQVADVEAQLAAPTKPLSDFSYTPFGSSSPQQLSAQVGKPLMVNFWAVWCEPCKMELPDFQELYTQHQGEFEIIGLCVDKQRDPEGFVKSQGYSWQFGYDGNGHEVYQVQGIPRTLFINRDGQVAVDFTGALTRPALEAALHGILK